MAIHAQTTDGQRIRIDLSALDQLRSTIHGKLILPDDSEYDQERAIWNGMIDRRPALIVQCAGTADVIRALRFAKEHKLLVSVKGGGHNIAGRAIGDDIFLIDLSRLRYVHVDPEQATATVSPGATLADVDQETAIYGLALPVGVNSTTGISGLTLGGGFGWLSRKFGLTIDNLLSVELISVDGERLLCSKDKNPELFWAIRGGGGNFGIVTSFTFRLHKVGPMVIAGPVVFALSDAKEVLMRYREFCKNAPDELTTWVVMRDCPPFPFVKASIHGNPVLVLVAMYNGPQEVGKKIVEQIKQLGPALGDGLGPCRFADFQKAFDAFQTAGARNFWKTHTFKALDDRLIDTLVEYAQQMPNHSSEIFFTHMGGQTNRVAKDATAYPHRDIEFMINVHTRWEDTSDDDSCTSWARKFYEATKPFATGGAYVNFVSAGDESLDGAFAANIKKLGSIKAKYDPDNVLRSNLNISPSP